MLVAKPNISQMRFLYLIKAAKVNNVDTIIAESPIGGVTGDISG